MRRARVTKAGLQLLARAVGRSWFPWLFFQQRMRSPSTVMEPVQVKWSVKAAAPLSSAAEQVSILKVEPGSYTSVMTVSRISSRRVSMSFRGGLLGS